jgi:hypothetical protein
MLQVRPTGINQPTERKWVVVEYWCSHSLSQIYSSGNIIGIYKNNENLFEESYLLGYKAVWSVESQPTFRRKMSPPHSGSKIKPSKKTGWKQVVSRLYAFIALCYAGCSPPVFTLVSCLDCSSTLKMEAKFSSETSVDFQRTARSYIPQYRTLHNRRFENLKSYIFIWSVIHISKPKVFYKSQPTFSSVGIATGYGLDGPCSISGSLLSIGYQGSFSEDM